MNSLLSYDTSPLNPALKILIPLLFLAALVFYFSTQKYYSEKLRVFIDILILFAFFAVLAGVFRYFGDGIDFGFTKDYSLKWFQSLLMVAEAGCFMLAGYTILHLFEGADNEELS
jgi:hypothetical protein